MSVQVPADGQSALLVPHNEGNDRYSETIQYQASQWLTSWGITGEDRRRRLQSIDYDAVSRSKFFERMRRL